MLLRGLTFVLNNCETMWSRPWCLGRSLNNSRPFCSHWAAKCCHAMRWWKKLSAMSFQGWLEWRRALGCWWNLGWAHTLITPKFQNTMYICMYVCIYVTKKVYVYITIYNYMYICTCVYMYICIYVYKYVCICIYDYLYICINVYMYICKYV